MSQRYLPDPAFDGPAAPWAGPCCGHCGGPILDNEPRHEMHNGEIYCDQCFQVRPYFRGPGGAVYHFDEIAARIVAECPEMIGEPVQFQLEALGLLDEAILGDTPCQIPSTFVDHDAEVIPLRRCR